MSMHIRFGNYGPGEGALVELGEGTVDVRFDGEQDEHPVDRMLTPSEARELAAALNHYALEAELKR